VTLKKRGKEGGGLTSVEVPGGHDTSHQMTSRTQYSEKDPQLKRIKTNLHRKTERKRGKKRGLLNPYAIILKQKKKRGTEGPYPVASIPAGGWWYGLGYKRGKERKTGETVK